jgi:hypothetical protein
LLGSLLDAGKSIVAPLAEAMVNMQKKRSLLKRFKGPIQQRMAIRPTGKSQSEGPVLPLEFRP